MWTKCKSSVPAGQPCEEYTHSWWTCLNQQYTYEHHNLAKVIEFTAESANHSTEGKCPLIFCHTVFESMFQ